MSAHNSIEQSLRGHPAALASLHVWVRDGLLIRALAVVFAVAVLASTRAATAQCGNGVVEGDEECDLGGTCIGGAAAGTACHVGDSTCTGGTCTTFGGQGCAANCTFETDVAFALVPGQTDGLGLVPGTSGVAIASDFLSIPLPLGSACNGGPNNGWTCVRDADCPGSACVPPRETLTIGKPRGGKIPLVVKAASVRFPAIPVSTLQCGCIRGVAAKTCGGTLFESDGVTPATDCSPRFSAGDTVCSAAGKLPCTFMHGAGNTASGEIGCNGLDDINVSATQDSGGAGGIAGPPMITFSGVGGPGSAVVRSSVGVSYGGGGLCVGTDFRDLGADGVFCTDDDPPSEIALWTWPAVTGIATAVVHNANGSDGRDLGPVSATGAPFSCAALAQGSPAGGGFAEVGTMVHIDTIGDVAVTMQFFASGTAPPTPTASPTPTSCIGDCNGSGTVTVDEIVTMVNIALGTPGLCPNGVPTGATVDISLIITAVNHALNRCGG